MDREPKPLLLRTLAGETVERPPVWFMRQAGRCLPEYHELRARAGGFLNLVFDPKLASEVTLQPMRRFAYDAAIVFSDIPLVPQALGQALWYEEGEGPRLGPLPDLDAMAEKAATVGETLGSVGETVRLARAGLEPERALIGFAGAPWTLATYMLQGRGGEAARAVARARAVTERATIERLVDILADATASYLIMQARAGAQALQIFESWSDLLPEDVFERLVIGPHARIVGALKAAGVTAPVIGFPRGAGALVERYAIESGVQVVGLDVQAPAALGRRLQRRVAIQGALDPVLLRAGGQALADRIDGLLRQWTCGPYVFNLGHGVLPDTPVEHIAAAVAQVTAWRNR
ncbi:MAG TPA: uroporphyrinogen decarboxylase [Caulobacteraceae bacterium]|nr:uroporphyrinogen decarboxylase [Caulobacteraceae bacterium]